MRAAFLLTPAPPPCPTASPALVDVDVVHTVSAEGCLGQCLNHVVTLQHHIPLGGPEGKGVRPCWKLENPAPPHLPGVQRVPSAYCLPAAHAARKGCRSGC